MERVRSYQSFHLALPTYTSFAIMARKVPVFGLGIGEWIAEVNNGIASRDRAIASDNAITVLVIALEP